MAQTIKILGSQPGTGNTLGISVYKVPLMSMSTLSTILISNNTSNTQTFKMWLQPENTGSAPGINNITEPPANSSNYLYYNQSVDGYSSFAITLGITMGAGASVVCSTSSTNMSINIFGVEVN